MNAIRDQIQYPRGPVRVCMRGLSVVEQYECARLIMAAQPSDICVCTHEATGPAVESVLQRLGVRFVQCYSEPQAVRLYLEPQAAQGPTVAAQGPTVAAQGPTVAAQQPTVAERERG